MNNAKQIKNEELLFTVYKTIKCNSKWVCECSGDCNSLVVNHKFNPDNFYRTPNQVNGLLTRYEPEDESKRQEFRLFKSFTDFNEYLYTIDTADRCYHEVIIGNMPQKVKLDIDIDKRPSSELLLEIEYKICPIVRLVFFNMYYDQIAELSLIHGFDISNPNIVDTCITLSNSGEVSSSNQGTILGECINKAGMHIIVKNFMVANNLEAKEFTRRLIKALPEKLKADNLILNDTIDNQVNKVIQNLRLIGCHKPFQHNRIKTLYNPIKDRAIDACITQGGLYILKPAISKITKHINTTDNTYSCDLNSFERNIKDQCDNMISDGEKDAHTFRNITVSDKTMIVVNYDRMASSYCELCDRMHDNDNTLVFYINIGPTLKDNTSAKNTTGKLDIRRSCRKYNQEKKVNKEMKK